MWTTNMPYNSSYFIILSTNSENVLNISANNSLVFLELQISLTYTMEIYYFYNEAKISIANLQMAWLILDSFLIQGAISLSNIQNVSVTCTTNGTNCTNGSVYFTTMSSGKTS